MKKFFFDLLKKLNKKQIPQKRTRYISGNNADNIIAAALDIAEEMLKSGGEIHRVETTVERICRAYGAAAVEVFAITSLITASVSMPDGSCASRIRRIYGTGNDLTKLEKLNALSRRICRGRTRFDRVAELFDEARRTEPYPAWVIFLGAVLAAGGFAVYFGGDIFDGIAAGLLGVVLTAIEYYRPSYFNQMARTVLCSFAAGVLSYMLVNVGIGRNVDRVMIGSIMILVPGLTFGNALRDLLWGDVISGSIEVVKSVLFAAMIAFGYGAAILLMSS